MDVNMVFKNKVVSHCAPMMPSSADIRGSKITILSNKLLGPNEKFTSEGLKNIQNTGSSLEASTKIYGPLVDSVHMDTALMSSGLGNKRKVNHKMEPAKFSEFSEVVLDKGAELRKANLQRPSVIVFKILAEIDLTQDD